MVPSRGIALSALTFSTFASPSIAFTAFVPSHNLHFRSFHGLQRSALTSKFANSIGTFRSAQQSRPTQPILGRISAKNIKTACSGIAIAAAAAVLLAGAPAFAEGVAAAGAEGILSSATSAGNAFLSSTAGFFSSPEMRDLGVYLAKTLIAWGIPVGAIGIVVLSAISSASRRGDPDSSFESDSSPQSLLARLRGQKPGEPVEYLKVQRLNDKLDSFRYSLQKAEEGARPALSEKRRGDFRRAFGLELEGSLSDKQV
jgi:hypothetical protein